MSISAAIKEVTSQIIRTNVKITMVGKVSEGKDGKSNLLRDNSLNTGKIALISDRCRSVIKDGYPENGSFILVHDYKELDKIILVNSYTVIKDFKIHESKDLEFDEEFVRNADLWDWMCKKGLQKIRKEDKHLVSLTSEIWGSPSSSQIMSDVYGNTATIRRDVNRRAFEQYLSGIEIAYRVECQIKFWKIFSEVYSAWPIVTDKYNSDIKELDGEISEINKEISVLDDVKSYSIAIPVTSDKRLRVVLSKDFEMYSYEEYKETTSTIDTPESPDGYRAASSFQFRGYEFVSKESFNSIEEMNDKFPGFINDEQIHTVHQVKSDILIWKRLMEQHNRALDIVGKKRMKVHEVFGDDMKCVFGSVFSRMFTNIIKYPTIINDKIRQLDSKSETYVVIRSRKVGYNHFDGDRYFIKNDGEVVTYSAQRVKDDKHQFILIDNNDVFFTDTDIQAIKNARDSERGILNWFNLND